MTQKKGPLPFTRLIEEIERQKRFRVGEASTADLSVTGLPYHELIVEAGDDDIAYLLGLQAFDSYAERRLPGVLYWHTKPEIERVRHGRNWGRRVRMKLLISDNPVVSRLAGEAAAAAVAPLRFTASETIR